METVTVGLAIKREIGDQAGIATSLVNLGNIALAVHDDLAARTLFEESLVIHRRIGVRIGIAWSLEGCAALSGHLGEAERAAVLFGAAAAIRTAV